MAGGVLAARGHHLTPRVTVLGAGVVGLSCAVALQDAGFDVRVVAREEPIVSEVAGGLWLPYATADDPRVLRWARESYDALLAAGHPLVDYLHLEREEPFWLSAVPDGAVRDARRDELPAGYARGWLARVPLVEVPRLLGEMRARVDVEVREVASLDELEGLVVNATGLGARALTGDASLVGARGQVAWLRAPGVTRAVCDEEALVYVLPRRDLCVVGGSHDAGDEDATVRPDATAAMLARAEALEPVLAGAELLDVRAGVRPVRDAGPRVEREGDVVHCYGHGGSGVTLAAGCAAEVVRLLATT